MDVVDFRLSTLVLLTMNAGTQDFVLRSCIYFFRHRLQGAGGILHVKYTGGGYVLGGGG